MDNTWYSYPRTQKYNIFECGTKTASKRLKNNIKADYTFLDGGKFNRNKFFKKHLDAALLMFGSKTIIQKIEAFYFTDYFPSHFESHIKKYGMNQLLQGNHVLMTC